jgi:hypothetical protein
MAANPSEEELAAMRAAPMMTTLLAMADPRFMAGALLSLQAMMKRLGVTEITINIREETERNVILAAQPDYATETMSFRLIPEEEHADGR